MTRSGPFEIGSVWRLKDNRGLPTRYRLRTFTRDGRVLLEPVNRGRVKTIKLNTLRGDYERV